MRAELILVALLVLGCEATAALGTACTRDSECGAPLVCAASRCRVECREGRDCPLPLECVLASAASNAGVCTLRTEASCEGSCPAPLECIGGACRQECERPAECARDMVCVSGACVRPVPDASGCDPLTDEGCAAGEFCSAEGTDLACAVLEDRGAGEVGATCTADQDCAPGYVCPENVPIMGFTGREQRLCVRVCVTMPESSCGPRSICRDAGGRVNGTALVELPSGLGSCTEPCELGTDMGCPARESCTVGDFDAEHVESFCRATPVDPLAPFAACTRSAQCPALHDCQTGPAGVGARVYRPFCDPKACPSGSTCERLGTLTDGREIHLCSIPL